jgi:hypothetical protein
MGNVKRRTAAVALAGGYAGASRGPLWERSRLSKLQPGAPILGRPFTRRTLYNALSKEYSPSKTFWTTPSRSLAL